MSGICSMHQGHDPTCNLCLAIPLTEYEKAYYEGYAAYPEHCRRNGWAHTEVIVLDAYEALERAVRELVAGGPDTQVVAALAELDELRRLKRGFR